MASRHPVDFLPPPARRALGGLRFRPLILAHGPVAGAHPSLNRGQSLEFSDLKGYSAGDDPQQIDWKVLARTDKLYVRRFFDETNLTAWMVLDASGSMALDDKVKYLHGASMLTGLSYVLLRQGDEVGVRVAKAGKPRWCVPRGIPSHLTAITDIFGDVEPSGGTSLSAPLLAIASQVKSGAVIIIASDLLTNWQGVISILASLSARGNAVVLVHLLTQKERTFPFDGSVVFSSAETGESVLVPAGALRRRYLSALAHFEGDVRGACHSAGIVYFAADLDNPPHVNVSNLLGVVESARRARGRGQHGI